MLGQSGQIFHTVAIQINLEEQVKGGWSLNSGVVPSIVFNLMTPRVVGICIPPKISNGFGSVRRFLETLPHQKLLKAADLMEIVARVISKPSSLKQSERLS